MSGGWLQWGREALLEAETDKERVLILLLASMANAAGECWPRHAYLARHLDCSERQLRRLLSAWEQRGRLVRLNAGGRGRTVSYRLVKVDTQMSGFSDEKVDIQMSGKVDTQMSGPIQQDPKKTHGFTLTSETGAPTLSSLKQEGFGSLPETKGSGPTAQEVAATLPPVKTHPKTGAALSVLWCSIVSGQLGKLAVHGVREKGQCKHLVSKLGTEGAARAVRAVLSNWAGFVAHVKSAAGIKTAPASPQVGFVLRYCAEAANFAAPKVSQGKAPPAPQKQELKPYLYVGEAPATKEEVEAILKDVLDGSD